MENSSDKDSSKGLRSLARGLFRMSKQIPGLGSWVESVRFKGTQDYWESRYQKGGTSGVGSYGGVAAYKAEFLNGFVKDHLIKSVLEFGCGDGNQLSMAEYPKYLGFDVALTAIQGCMARFEHDLTKSFVWYDPNGFTDPSGLVNADLAISLEVIFHLIEDEIFEKYMKDLFNAAARYVIIFSSNTTENSDDAPHFRNRKFTDWVEDKAPSWKLIQTHIPPLEGLTVSDFYVYEKTP